MVRLKKIRLAPLLLLGVQLALGQPPSPGNKQLTPLKSAAERVAPDYRPRMLLEQVTVRGTVNNPLIEAADAAYLGIEDPSDPKSGLILVFSGENKQYQSAAVGLRAGSQIEADGNISLHAGQAVLKPTAIRQIAATDAPPPSRLRPLEAAGLAWLGLVVQVEGSVANYREAASGEILEFADGAESIRVFLPARGQSNERPLSAFHPGDRIRVRGLVTQFCLSPPYNRYFQLLVANANEIELVEAGPNLPPQIVPAAVLLVLLAILAAWYLQQKAKAQNRRVEQILGASELIYPAATARDVAAALRSGLTELLSIEEVHIYSYDEERKVLEKIADSAPASPRPFAQHSFHVEEGQTDKEKMLAKAVGSARIFQLTHSLRAAEAKLQETKAVETKAVETKEPRAETSESLLFLPMIHAGEVIGAILLSAKPGKVLLDEAVQPAIQHLANTTAHQISGIDAGALREQIHRGEKLAVAGQLIQGVVTELNAPLEKIRALSAEMPIGVALSIQQEVQRAAETVRRIVSVARAEQIDARPVDLRLLLLRLIKRVQQSTEGSELELESNIAPEQLYVLGSTLQLDQVFSNLLTHAQSAASRSLEQFLAVTLNRIGRSALIEIQFSGPFGENEGPDFSQEALGMAISRGLMQSHGGDLRFASPRAGRFRYEVELPSLSTNPSDQVTENIDSPAARGTTTALLVEPEMQTQRKLLALFGENGHRLVPVASMEEAAELAEKLRFDLILSCARPEGGTWIELFHRVHHRTMHFVLLSEGPSDRDASASSELIDGRSASVLRKPVEEEDVKRLLAQLQAFREG
jgi:signal transduction histidine kinase/CheY-like chemotaxis protein